MPKWIQSFRLFRPPKLSSFQKVMIVGAVSFLVFYKKRSRFSAKPKPLLKDEMTESERKWETYYIQTRKRDTTKQNNYTKLRDKLIEEYPDKEFKALDLGTGTGLVAFQLAESKSPVGKECGFRVIAEDANRNALEIVKEIAKEKKLEKCIITRHRDMAISSNPSKDMDVITGRLVFPFVTGDAQEAVNRNVTNSLVKGGYAIMEFFGTDHPWCSSKKDSVQCHSAAEVAKFFSAYSRVEINESRENMQTAAGENIPWHEIRVIAQK